MATYPQPHIVMQSQTTTPVTAAAATVIGMSSLADYEIYNQLGQGTFGVVTKARQRSSGKLVALKKFIINDKKEGFPITAFREITIMKKLRNVNVLQIVDMVHEEITSGAGTGTGIGGSSSGSGSFFYTVSPYISSDWNGLLNNPRINLSLPQVKCLLQQLLSGINYIHQSGYLHRDIKTANILLDHFGVVKIADFGLARLFHGPPPSSPNSPPGGGKYDYTGLVVTRWYRPPELLLGDRKYTTAVDMWGIGCVFGELFTRKPILEGKSDIHQAEIIFKLLGSPTIETFPNCHLINRNNIDLKNNYPRSLESRFSSLATPDAISLLAGMLTLNPAKRFNALKALDSSFFKTEPLPCEPSELANMEESHESDVKRFKEELKLQPSQQQQQQQQQQRPRGPVSTIQQNNSLNHSKYGAEPSYMARVESYAPLAPAQRSNHLLRSSAEPSDVVPTHTPDLGPTVPTTTTAAALAPTPAAAIVSAQAQVPTQVQVQVQDPQTESVSVSATEEPTEHRSKLLSSQQLSSIQRHMDPAQNHTHAHTYGHDYERGYGQVYHQYPGALPPSKRAHMYQETGVSYGFEGFDEYSGGGGYESYVAYDGYEGYDGYESFGGAPMEEYYYDGERDVDVSAFKRRRRGGGWGGSDRGSGRGGRGRGGRGRGGRGGRGGGFGERGGYGRDINDPSFQPPPMRSKTLASSAAGGAELYGTGGAQSASIAELSKLIKRKNTAPAAKASGVDGEDKKADAK